MYNSSKLVLHGLREKSQWAGEVREKEAWTGPSETGRCQEVYFLSAAVTNYHRQRWKQHKFRSLPFCRLEIRHRSDWAKTKASAELYFFLESLCMRAKSLQLCLTLHNSMDCSPPGKNTGVGCHVLGGIFLTQGSNASLLRLLCCSELLYLWATGGAPGVYERVHFQAFQLLEAIHIP